MDECKGAYLAHTPPCSHCGSYPSCVTNYPQCSGSAFAVSQLVLCVGIQEQLSWKAVVQGLAGGCNGDGEISAGAAVL